MIESWLVHDHLRVALKAWHSCPLHGPLGVGRQLGSKKPAQRVTSKQSYSSFNLAFFFLSFFR